MKVIRYTLTADGHVPSYVVDGGYLASPSGQPSPQDWLLVGLARNSAAEPAFADEAEFTTYATEVLAGAVDPDGDPVDPAAVAAAIWANF